MRDMIGNIILVSDKSTLYEIKNLVSYIWNEGISFPYIWNEGISFSYYKNSDGFSDSSEVALSWDKWIDNPQWSGNINSKEYIEFEIGAINATFIAQECLQLVPHYSTLA